MSSNIALIKQQLENSTLLQRRIERGLQAGNKPDERFLQITERVTSESVGERISSNVKLCKKCESQASNTASAPGLIRYYLVFLYLGYFLKNML